MPQRKNNSGKSSGPYKKRDDKNTGSSYKSGKPPFKKGNSENRNESFKPRSTFNRDPDELAPPRFLAKRESSGPYKKKPEGIKNSEGRKYNPEGRGRSQEKDSRGSRPDGPKTYKRRDADSGTGFRSNRNAPDSKSAPFKSRDKDSSNKPFRSNRNDKPFEEKAPYKKRENRSGDFTPDKRFGSDSKNKATFSGKSKDGRGDTFKKPAYDKKSGDSFQRNESSSNKDKPFRPKYDPEVKINKKSYTERKKELLGIKDDPDDIRLNKYIANAGICSRREADELIEHGLVTVNGVVITEMGYRVKKNDLVKYDGRKILPEPFVYILMNKPKDFITTTDDDKGRKTVMDLLADKIPQRVYPIGRLDRNTTGVLLLTNDGEVAQALTHPSFQIKKVYHAILDKKVNGTDLDKFVEGIELEDGMVHADAVAFVDNEDRRHVGVEIHSGKNRVVRRMFEHLGYEVEKLDRVSMGIFTKKDLPRGKWRFLKESEIGFLMKLKAKMP